jgi:copper chaperone CopZ
MKLLYVFALTAAIFLGCGKSDKHETSEKKDDNQTVQTSASDKSVEIQCAGMTCTGCENSVKNKVKKLEGVKEVIADHSTNVVKASYDPAKTNPEAIKEAITGAGFKVVSIK